MTPLDPGLAARLALLRQQFAAGLPARLGRIDAALAACRSDPSDSNAVAALLAALHSLGGTAGIFGFASVGEQARHAERQVMQWTNRRGTPEELEQISVRLQGWRSCC